MTRIVCRTVRSERRTVVSSFAPLFANPARLTFSAKLTNRVDAATATAQCIGYSKTLLGVSRNNTFYQVLDFLLTRLGDAEFLCDVVQRWKGR